MKSGRSARTGIVPRVPDMARTREPLAEDRGRVARRAERFPQLAHPRGSVTGSDAGSTERCSRVRTDQQIQVEEWSGRGIHAPCAEASIAHHGRRSLAAIAAVWAAQSGLQRLQAEKGSGVRAPLVAHSGRFALPGPHYRPQSRPEVRAAASVPPIPLCRASSQACLDSSGTCSSHLGI